MTRTLQVLFAALLAVSLVAVAPIAPVAADTNVSTEVVDIGTNHPLAANATADEFGRTGYVSGDLARYRVSMAVAESGGDIGMTPSLMRDTRNDYLQIRYNESYERTIRILLPRDYITPYTMEHVEALDSDHVASYKPARSGHYLAVTVTFDGPGTAVFPLQKDSSAGGALLETVDNRVKQLTGISPLGRNGKWQHIDGSEIAEEPAYPINATSEDVLIQYDARPNRTEEVWLNAPRGEKNDVPVYYFERESDSQLYVVSADNSQPDIRLKTEPSRTDRIRGDINDIKLVPDRIRDGAADYWPF